MSRELRTDSERGWWGVSSAYSTRSLACS